MPPLRAVQELTAHAVLRRGDAVVLVRAPGGSRRPWSLPGGGVAHGEHPRHAVARHAVRQLGATVAVRGLRDVVTDLVEQAAAGLSAHTLRVVYDLDLDGGEPGSAGATVLVAPAGELAGLPLTPYTARLLGLPAATAAEGPAPDPADPADPPDPPDSPGQPDLPDALDPTDAPDLAAAAQFQRAGAYALVVDGGRVLLSRFVGSGEWTLPGGGIDHGEDPRDAVRREVHEETGLHLVEARLSDVDSVHFVGHAPDGRLEDFHGVRVVYVGRVAPGEPHVVEVDGTTDAAAWVPLAELGGRRLTGLALHAMAHLR